MVTKTTQRSLPFTPVGPGSPSSASRSSRDDDDDENTEEDGDASTGLPTDASDMNTDDDGVVDVEGDGDGGVSVERVERQVRVTDVLVMKDGATGAVLGNLSREKTVEGNAEGVYDRLALPPPAMSQLYSQLGVFMVGAASSPGYWR